MYFLNMAPGVRQSYTGEQPMRASIVCWALGALLVALSVPAAAQQPEKGYRVGILAGSSQALGWQSSNEALQQGLRELGYIEGKNLILEYRYAEGNVARFPALAAELVRLNVDLIVAIGHPPVLAAKQATQTIPIVMTVPTDPVATGLVESLAQPGGNITGLTSLTIETAGKRLELFKATVPPWSASPSSTIRPIRLMPSTRKQCRQRGRRGG